MNIRKPRRHNIKAAKMANMPKANPIKAAKGQFLNMWFDGQASLTGNHIGPIGSGFRRVMVLRCTAKGVTLFYPPTLTTFRLTLPQWESHHAELYQADVLYLMASIATTARFYLSGNMKFSWASTYLALTILHSLLGNTTTSTTEVS